MTRSRVLIRALVLTLIIAVILFFGRAILDVSMFLISVLLLPVLFLVLGWFIFSVWGRTYLRAWHIRRIRNARDLREAVERGRNRI